MRVTIFYLACTIASVQLLFAQPGAGLPEQRMTRIGMKHENFEMLFIKLQQQTGLSFVLPGEVKRYKKISLADADRTVKELLDLVLTERGLRYFFNGNMLYVYLELNEAPGEDANKQPSTPPALSFRLSGSVKDAANRLPLPGVNIVVKGTTRGTATDANGHFTVDVFENDVLICSSIGYKTVEIAVGSRTTLEVVMEATESPLAEVVINAGYYETTDKTKTGNIVKVVGKDIETQPVTSPLMALQGRVAGLQITPVTGAPGSAPKIRVRGENSLREDGGYPLYVIDGIPVDATPPASNSINMMDGKYDPLGTLNPGNIESIEILKDGDATAIYGSRGANGVILITTKHATGAGKTNVDINIYRGIGEISKKIELLNTQQYIQMRHEAMKNEGKTPALADPDINGTWDTTRYTDWQDVLLGGTAKVTHLQATVSGGSANTAFSLGTGVHRETTIFPGDFRYQQVSLNLSVHHTSPDGKLKIFSSNNYGFNKHRLFDGYIVTDALELPPNAPALYDKNGDLNWAIDSTILRRTWSNPLNKFNTSHNSTMANLVSNGGISYEMLPGLLLKINVGYNEVKGAEVIKQPIHATDPITLSLNRRTGIANFAYNDRKSWLIEPQVRYSGKVQKHGIQVTVGGTWQHSISTVQQITGYGYTSDALLGSTRAAATLTYARDDFAEYKYMAVFARIGYDWKHKYLLNITGRRDGSSRFGPSNRFGNFGAVGLAWVFSKETFIQNVLPLLNWGKLRVSYGTSGNDQIGDYRYYSLYDINVYQYQNGVTLSPNSLYNPDFTWEVTKKLEGAIQLGFWNDRISLEAAWYQNRSSSQLVDYQLPTTTGFPTVQANFNATVQNSGWEFLFNTENVNASGFRWTTSLNLTIPRNKLIEFPGIENSPYAKTYKVGAPLSVQRLYVWKGVNPITGLHEVVDQNEDGFINDEDKRFTSALAQRYYGGLNNTITYRSFELSFLLQVINQNANMYYQVSGGRRANVSVKALERWQQKGDITNIEKFLTLNPPGEKFVRKSTYIIEDASFVRLKTLSLSYTLSPHLAAKVRAAACRVFIQGQNLFTITHYHNLDPETGARIPPLRMITGGIQLRF